MTVIMEPNVTMSVGLVPVPPAGLELAVKRDVLLGFTGRTARRCASAGTMPSATTSQAPAAAPPAGHRRNASWPVRWVHLVRTAVSHVTATMVGHVTQSAASADAHRGGLEPTANRPVHLAGMVETVSKDASVWWAWPVIM